MVVNQNNGKIYVGKTAHPISKRWKGHIYAAKNGRALYFHNAIRKHGPENFTIRQIDCTENEQEANELEKLYIGIFQSHKKEHGYNTTLGGEGVIPNEETRRKIGAASRGRKPMLGKHHSEETKLKMKNLKNSLGIKPSAESRMKMSQAQKGRKHSEKSKEKMRIAQHGHAVSEETCAKISAAHLGKSVRVGMKHTEESIKKMSLIRVEWWKRQRSEKAKNV